jgi:transcriptional regulator with GAF, ATPase, and Fis domain
MEPSTRISRLERLLALNKLIVAEEDVGRLLELALEAAMSFIDADRGFVLLREPDGSVRVRAARNLDRDTVRSKHFGPSRHIADLVLRLGEAILSDNVAADERFAGSDSLTEMAVKAVMCIPIRSREQVVGAIYLDKRRAAGGFGAEDLRLLQDVGDVAAVAVEMRRLVRRLEVQGDELRRAKDELERLTAALQEDVAAKSVEIARAGRDLDAMTRALGRRYSFQNIVGRSPAMQRIFDVLNQVIEYPVPVLITGESGTGKELIARALHHGGPRAERPFMAINCAAIPENLLESELFGYKRGAFTGANTDKEGLFRAARDGTVFLDEIGEMPLPLQTKLLRVLQEKEVRPIGGRDSEPIAARIVAATNRSLANEVKAGRFREDLYYRLNVVEVHVPPLRERLEDVPVLAEHFLAQFTAEMGLPARRFAPDAIRALMGAPWPGNVRQLENAVKSSAILSRGDVIGAADLRMPAGPPGPAPTPVVDVTVGGPPHARPAPPAAAPRPPAFAPPHGIATRDDWEQHEKSAILDALVRSQWNKTRAARLLGVSRRNLYRKLERYGIEGGED